MKKIVIFVILVLVLGFLFHHFFDNDRSLKLPIDQQIQTISKEINSSNPLIPINHIVIITMENKSYKDIVDSKNAPYINSLIKQYSFADNYFGVAHPSLPNYIALIGGSTFGIKADCNDCFVDAKNLIDQLEQKSKTWKGYMESIPKPCFIGNDYPYAQKHNPFIYFDDIRNNPKRCNNIVPLTQLSQDLKKTNTTPNFLWVTPNLCHDMHDCSVKEGDTWLSKFIPTVLESPAFTQQESVLIITWDEGEGSSTNQIPAIFIGNTVKRGFITHEAYTHYSLLQTIENLWNLSPLTKNVKDSKIIQDIFK